MRKIMLVVVLGIVVLPAGCNRAPPLPDASEIDPQTSLQEWVNDLQTGEDEQRIFAALALGEWGPKARSALPAITAGLRDPNRFVRAKIAEALPYIDPTGDDVQAHLSAATRDPEPVVRLEAAKALGRIGQPAWPATEELDRLLMDDDVDVRRASAKTLGIIGPMAEKAKPKLELVSEIDTDETVRTLAEEAVKKIDRK